MIQKKICMLGSFAVGKTSLVAQFVSSIFSERYLTTVGVKIDRKSIVIDDRDVNLLLWDIHGEDEFQKVRASYLRGMAGYLLIVDPTRPDTLDVALQLHELAVSIAGELPFLLLLNKVDIRDQWQTPEERIESLQAEGWQTLMTSAKTGENVATAFESLAKATLS